MANTICINENISTTKHLIQEKPTLVNNPDDKFETILFLPNNPERKAEGGLRTKGYFKMSYEDKPLISVITVVFNGETYLEETIKSVINQSYDNVEYIIIDGGSTDGTLDIIGKYEDKIDYWVSEADGGIYDAMNKGLSLSSGKYIGIINADDWYMEEVFQESMEALIATQADYSFASIQKIPSGLIVRPVYPLENGKVFQGMMYPHITAFISRDIYKNIGLFNTKYKIAADYDMAQRIHNAGYRAVSVDRILAELIEGGASDTIKSKSENRDIAISHGKGYFSAYLSYFCYLLKHCIRQFFPKKTINIIYKLKKSRFQYEA